jgi:hypothetical protein
MSSLEKRTIRRLRRAVLGQRAVQTVLLAALRTRTAVRVTSLSGAYLWTVLVQGGSQQDLANTVPYARRMKRTLTEVTQYLRRTVQCCTGHRCFPDQGVSGSQETGLETSPENSRDSSGKSSSAEYSSASSSKRGVSHRKNPGAQNGWIIPRRTISVRLPPASGFTLLRDKRVGRLQARILDRIFRTRFGVRIRPREIEVLSVFSSSAWLSRNLLVAAGYGSGDGSGHRACVAARVPVSEFLHRCSVVYPAFLNAMRLHLRYLTQNGAQAQHCAQAPQLNGLENGTAMLPDGIPDVFVSGRETGLSGHEPARTMNLRDRIRLRWMTQKYATGPNGEIRQSLYPDSLRIETLRLDLENIRYDIRVRFRRERTMIHLIRFDRYLDAVTLAGSSRRALNGLEKINMEF